MVCYMASTEGVFVVLCLSTDVKPTPSLETAILFETDTGDIYIKDNNSNTWKKK